MDKVVFYLPQLTSEKVLNIVREAIDENSLNLRLFLDKYVLWFKEKDGEMKADLSLQVSFLRKINKDFKNVRDMLFNPKVFGKKFRDGILSNVRLGIPFKALPITNYKSYAQRMENLHKDLTQIGYSVESTESSLNWRLSIDLGASSIYETSLLLHKNYSVPFIPASAVKGATNHYVYDEALKEGKVTKEEYTKIFGDQNKKGEVIFFDALPVIKGNKDFVVLDVMNVHYKPYYESGEIPGDWYDPIPISFLAVEKGTKFKICVASKDNNLAKRAKEFLGEAINKIGIGAKTSAGYGYFDAGEIKRGA